MRKVSLHDAKGDRMGKSRGEDARGLTLAQNFAVHENEGQHESEDAVRGSFLPVPLPGHARVNVKLAHLLDQSNRRLVILVKRGDD